MKRFFAPMALVAFLATACWTVSTVQAQPSGPPGPPCGTPPCGGGPGQGPRPTPELDPLTLTALATAGYFGYRTVKGRLSFRQHKSRPTDSPE